MPHTHRLHTVAEARALLGGIGHTTLYGLLAAGELGSVKIGKRRFVPAAAIEEYISRLRAAAQPTDRVAALVAAIDVDGRVDVDAIPPGTTLADLDAAKRIIAERPAAIT